MVDEIRLILYHGGKFERDKVREKTQLQHVNGKSYVKEKISI